MKLTTVGIDLAKQVFQVHGVDERGKAVLKKQLKREQVTAFFVNVPPCLPQGIGHIAKRLPQILEDGQQSLPGPFLRLLERLGDHLKELDRQVGELEVQIQLWHRQNAASKKLACLPGVGPITASALVASIGNAKSFENGRQLAAWLGLVPRQHSSGGKPTLLGISKRGDGYLRTLLIHGARSVIRVAERKPAFANSWLQKLIDRRHKSVAAVALANKNARIAWALLAHGRDYEVDYDPRSAVNAGLSAGARSPA
jgi:transposase